MGDAPQAVPAVRTVAAGGARSVPTREVAPTDPRVQALLSLQRTAGNAAVAALLGTRGRAPRPTVPRAAPPPRVADARTVQREPPPAAEVRQGPIGDVVVPLPDWPLVHPPDVDSSWTRSLESLSLLRVPIPELGITLDVGGHASARAGFSTHIEGGLQNIRVGLSYGQAALLGAGAVLGGAVGPIGGPLAVLALLGSQDIRGVAQLAVRGRARVNLDLGAGLTVGASAAGLITLADVSTGISAGASAEAGLQFLDTLGIYWNDGHLRFRDHPSLELSLRLAFNVRAFAEAGLLGHRWRRSWELASADLGRVWRVGATLDLDYDNGLRVANVRLAQEAMELAATLRDLLTAAQGQSTLTAVAPPSTPGGAGGGPPPEGRTRTDPIDMVWHKSPGLYPPSIVLGGERYFFTEPAFLAVPDRPRLSDVRRDALTDSEGNPVVRVGVAPGSKFYPSVGSVWPRVRSGVVRTGVKQDQFRRLLAEHGYSWGGQEADHVRDLQWRGEDAYANLWPLDAGHNQAANDVLSQLVTYRDANGQVVTVPLHQTPLNLYFRIRSYA